MGIYSHYTADQLTALRDKLTAALHDRLINPSASSWGDRRIQFDQQTADIRKEVDAVNAEIATRSGTVTRGPIYLV
jgi:hypothetical protein